MHRVWHRRDAWAGSFHSLLTEKAPRTDCPMHLPEPPPPTQSRLATHGAVPPPRLTRRQARRLARFSEISGVPVPPEARASQRAAEEWLEVQWRRAAGLEQPNGRDEL